MEILMWLIIGAIVIWLVVLVVTLLNLFKREDINFATKALWGIIIFIAPVLGLIIYLIMGRK